MSFVRKTLKNAAIGVGVADEPNALSVFLEPGCAAAIWRRQMARPIRNWLDCLDPMHLPRGRLVTSATAARDMVAQLGKTAGLPTGPERDWLEADIAHLAQVFSDLMGVRYLRLRLDVINTDACRKFHLDAITARLICTYRGTGTQYGISTDGAEPTRVFTVQTGAPILLRGSLWPEQPPSGLLHRSPPIAGTGETRLVLVLDPIFETEGDQT